MSFKKGLSFGLTSGVITTLGLIVGLNSSTHSNIVVIGGILVIAIADAMSDALGVHVSVESENKFTTREIWEATVSTFISKFIIALTFVVPILVFELSTAIIACILWGITLIVGFNYNLAKQEKAPPLKVISEHLLIAIAVIVFTNFIGQWVDTLG